MLQTKMMPRVCDDGYNQLTINAADKDDAKGVWQWL